MRIILLYLSPLSKQGLIHSLDFNHFNPQIKRPLNGIKTFLLTLGVNRALE
jgi:hypothetical protein